MLTDLRAFVLSDLAISSMVGNRMYPVRVQQDTEFPALSFNQVSATRLYDLCGPQHRVKARITINSWGTTYGDVRELSNAVRKKLEELPGVIGGSPGVSIDDVKLDNEIDFDEPEAGLVGVFRVMQDYIFSYVED